MKKRFTLYFYVSSKNKSTSLYSKKKKKFLNKTDEILHRAILNSFKSPKQKCVDTILKFAEI